MRRVRRALLWLVAFLAVATLAAAFGYRKFSLPKIDGTLTVAGLSASVDVVRDAVGIPHIYARSDDDAWFTLGYVHAQDRLWQMELNRRTASGRLAEVLGAGALDVDRFLRTMGIARNAAAIAHNLDAKTRRALDRYAAGVNANLAERRSRPGFLMPPEFVLTGAPFPEPWSAADSVGWSTMMAWDLSTNWSSELARMRLAQRLTKRQIDELMPPYPGNPQADAEGHTSAAVADAPLVTADYPALYRSLKLDGAALANDAASLLALAPPSYFEGMGSNDWVVSGARTASGKPLLANDPHLTLTAPSIWYMAHLAAPGLDVIGATLPGLPVVVIGRNRKIAWGVTNTGPDTQDLYIEELRGQGAATEVRTPDGWQPLESRSETIRVKGAADFVLTVRNSRHGPLISDVSKAATDALAPLGTTRYALAFQWAALRPDDRTVQAGLALDIAGDWGTFIAAMKDFHSPQQNFVYADIDGNIGFVAPGRVPVRKPDNDLKGQAPAPGWDARYDWNGFIPFDRLPQRLNPPEGRIVTANHKVVPDDYAPFLTSEWAAPFRARRIEALLDAPGKQDVATFAAIQGDVRSLAVAAMLPLLLDTRPASEAGEETLASLAAWDGTMRGDRPEPLLYAAWMRELVRLITRDELGDLFPVFWEQRTVFLINVLSDRDGQSRWCDDIGTPEVETCATMKARALDLAIADLTRRIGPDRGRWRWDALHVVRAEHRPFSRVPSLARFFELAGPIGGDSNTVSVAGYTVRDETDPFVAHHGSSLRQIVDFADLEQSRFMPSTGESGNRLSPFYANLFEPWRSVESVPMQMDRPAVTAGAAGTLHLRPDQ
ncbi:MAG: penicillin acylase family protein [Burkholderiaceae bacterium]